MGPDEYESLGHVIIWVTCGIVAWRFRRPFYAIFLQSKNGKGPFRSLFSPVFSYWEFRKELVNARNEWAEEVIEQENDR